MIAEHETLSCKASLLLIPQFCTILLCIFSYTLSALVILQNYKGSYIYIYKVKIIRWVIRCLKFNFFNLID